MGADRGICAIDVAVLGVDADPVYAAASNCSGVIHPWKHLPAMLRSLLLLS